ncbi:Chemotaxis regulator [Sterolibacterium denitrificans]|uniref:Protein phosphatase CheZ n=2 Tax=Sterolibacterium denitrificans TaxID=157592 RepID=A0A7Z7HUG7_9PROT|nr:protein phosphatase CheZ [Sterolibacterium denitrificans]SMB29986.1 Chemotaxis regulator [Sterolibacterium denitrificans]
MMNTSLPPSSRRESGSFDESGDSEDLQALFDSIAAGASQPVAAKEPAAAMSGSGDSAELQALFDSVAGQADRGAGAAAAAVSAGASQSQQVDPTIQVFNRIGQMTRELHNTMRELGYDRILEDAVQGIPDARQRLAYIIQMTEQAASRVLNAVEVARPVQDALHDQSKTLAARWEQVFANQLSPAEFKLLAADTHGFLRAMPQQVAATNVQLTEIMMAQDFQDLTGQVIKKIVELAHKMEHQLLSVLLEAMPPEVRAETSAGLLNGPVVNGEGRTDVVHSQAQVDDLLESLGF